MKKGSLSESILFILEKAIEGTLFLEEITYSVQIKDLKGIPRKKSDKGLVMAVRRLRTKGYITTEVRNEGDVILKLTQFGKDFLRSTVENEWDGIYRIVVWDIPESKRTIRNLLRRKLKNWGFVSYQKSVWVSKKNVTKQLRNLISELDMEKWVGVVESEDPTLEALFIRPSVKSF